MDVLKNCYYTILCIAGIVVLNGCADKKHYTEALSPADEMKHFELDSDFKVELFAAEPDVLSPVDLAWDSKGNAYVIEMGDYPDNAKPGSAKGRIRVLKDINQDGIIDSSIVFADNLPSATSMLPWKDGLIVTAAPDILYLKDTTGDLRADTREVLFTGFFATNSEAQITCLRFGVDNWIYANNNAQEGEVSFLKNPAAPKIKVADSDFRFRLDKGLFENESGWGQFGQTLDDYGHRFYSQNTLHIQQSPIHWRYLHRHNYLPRFTADINISDHDLEMFQKTPAPYWRQERTKRRQEEFDKQKLDRKEYADKHFTGSSGATFYLSDDFPEEFNGSIFSGDVAGNLVHRDLVTPGKINPAFIAKRSAKEKDREFLASTDPWTRPANFTVGPDGYLYMIDIYRQHIEAPTSVPEDLKAEMDYSNGYAYGRIYRISPKNGTNKKTLPILANKTAAELVEMLSDRNQWIRQRAHMLLIERHDLSIVPAAIKMFETNSDPRARIHSLYVLEGLEKLNAGLVSKALKDPEPGIREQAIILSEKYPQLLPQLIQMVNDSSAQVVLQAALSLGNYKNAEAENAVATVLAKYYPEQLFRMSILSSNYYSGPGFLKNLITRGTFFKDSSADKNTFVKDLSYVTGARNNDDEIARMIELTSSPAIKNNPGMYMASLDGLIKGIKAANSDSLVVETQLTKYLKKLSQNEEAKAAIKKVLESEKDNP